MDGVIVGTSLGAGGAVLDAEVVNVLATHAMICRVDVGSSCGAELGSLCDEVIDLSVVVFGVDLPVDPIVGGVVQVAHPLLVGLRCRLLGHCLVDGTEVLELSLQCVSFGLQHSHKFFQLLNLGTVRQALHLSRNFLFVEEQLLVAAGNGVVVVEGSAITLPGHLVVGNSAVVDAVDELLSEIGKALPLDLDHQLF